MIKKVLRNCNVCNREYSYDSRQKNAKYCSEKCRGVFNRQKNIKGDEFIDYVFCQICFLKFKEINNEHLLLHNISSNEYDILYNTPRTSEKTKIKKNTLTSIMNDDFSKKLSYSHSLNGYKDKYGEVEGVIKYNEMIKNKKYKNGFNYYKDKYGKEAEFKYKEVQNKKGSSLKNYIIKYGKTEGKIKYNDLIKKRKYLNSLFGYIDKNGFEIGLQKWMKKNNKISISNSIIKIEEKKDFLLYIKEVNIYTRISLSLNKLFDIDKRGKYYGFDLDHVFSKVNGFKNKIPPYIIGHISNLKIVDSSYNRKKQHKSDIDISKIEENYNNDVEYIRIISNMKVF